MAVSTIETHLAHFVGTGELSVDDFVPPDLTALIAENIDENDFRIGIGQIGTWRPDLLE